MGGVLFPHTRMQGRIGRCAAKCGWETLLVRGQTRPSSAWHGDSGRVRVGAEVNKGNSARLGLIRSGLWFAASYRVGVCSQFRVPSCYAFGDARSK